MGTKIFIVDDHAMVRRGLRELLSHEADLVVCGEAATVADALSGIKEQKPQLIIIDISLKGGSGIELIKQIRVVDDEIKMLVLSVHDEALYSERVLRAGAHGYVSKSDAAENVLQAIRQILQGMVYLSSGMTNRVLSRVARGQQLEDDPVMGLTDRELEVFEQIGNGQSTSQIAEELHVSVKTVESHRENIKNKLSLKSGTELSHRAVQWVTRHEGNNNLS
jgi:DNA-binding NarL/FixJ family response regulator